MSLSSRACRQTLKRSSYLQPIIPIDQGEQQLQETVREGERSSARVTFSLSLGRRTTEDSRNIKQAEAGDH